MVLVYSPTLTINQVYMYVGIDIKYTIHGSDMNGYIWKIQGFSMFQSILHWESSGRFGANMPVINQYMEVASHLLSRWCSLNFGYQCKIMTIAYSW